MQVIGFNFKEKNHINTALFHESDYFYQCYFAGFLAYIVYR